MKFSVPILIHWKFQIMPMQLKIWWFYLKIDNVMWCHAEVKVKFIKFIEMNDVCVCAFYIEYFGKPNKNLFFSKKLLLFELKYWEYEWMNIWTLFDTGSLVWIKKKLFSKYYGFTLMWAATMWIDQSSLLIQFIHTYILQLNKRKKNAMNCQMELKFTTFKRVFSAKLFMIHSFQWINCNMNGLNERNF